MPIHKPASLDAGLPEKIIRRDAVLQTHVDGTADSRPIKPARVAGFYLSSLDHGLCPGGQTKYQSYLPHEGWVFRLFIHLPFKLIQPMSTEYLFACFHVGTEP